MARKKLKAPPPGRGDALELLSTAERNPGYPTLALASQEASLAVLRLVARYALSPSLARAVSEANQWGR